MDFKRKRGKIRREQLDEMSRTMSVIPMSELMLMMGEYPPGYYNIEMSEIDAWLNNHLQDPNYKEAVYYWFNDGTVGIFISAGNTDKLAHVAYYKNPETGKVSFSGKYFRAWGHTHKYSSTPTVYSDGKHDDISVKNNIGTLATIYYEGVYYKY